MRFDTTPYSPISRIAGHSGSPGRREDGDDQVDEFGIELPAALEPEVGDGFIGRPGLAVRPARGHGVAAVGDRQDPGFERDPVSGQPAGLPGPAPRPRGGPTRAETPSV